MKIRKTLKYFNCEEKMEHRKKVSKKVLLALKKSNSLVSLKEGLETRGYSVDTAPVGIEALNKVINSNYNLLITEVYFEDISGLGLHHIGKEKNSLLKTIAVNDRGDIMRNIASVFGIDKIVDVPIEPSVLCAEVDQLLEH